MSKSATVGVVGALALMVAGGIVALDSTVTVDLTPISELRPARLPGECPAERPPECEHMRQLPTGDCLCLTPEASVDGEGGNTPDLMWVCPNDGQNRVMCAPPGPPPRVGCRVVANSGSVACGVSMRGIDLGNMPALRAVCAPCDVQPGKWGPCPQCWFDGNCAERCGG